jgi:CBS domain-containing protein
MDRESPKKPPQKVTSLPHPNLAPAQLVFGVILLGPVSNLHPPVPKCVHPDTPIGLAIQVANRISAGSVLVTDNGRLVGIITERDVLYRVAGQVDLDAPVETVMTADPATIRSDESIAVALRKMHWGGFRHIPVVDGAGNLTGILSVKDILRLIISLTPEP